MFLGDIPLGFGVTNNLKKTKTQDTITKVGIMHLTSPRSATIVLMYSIVPIGTHFIRKLLPIKLLSAYNILLSQGRLFRIFYKVSLSNIGPFQALEQILLCPQGGIYINSVRSLPVISKSRGAIPVIALPIGFRSY